MTHTDRGKNALRLATSVRAVAVRAATVLAALLLVSPAAHAQFGASVGIRVINGEDANAANSKRRGYEGRAFYDWWRSEAFGVRADLSVVQMQFLRDNGAENFQVSENSIESSVTAMGAVSRGALTGVYALAGPVVAFRAVCGSGQFTNTGRVACNEGEKFTPSFLLGVGYRRQIRPSRDLLFELRYIDEVVSGAGNSLLAITVGLQARR